MNDKDLVLTKLVDGVNVFDVSRLGDMSGFDPANEVDPGGDVIKIAVNGPFSGPAAALGDAYYTAVAWVAYDINQRGGLMVDGKRKKIQVLKANNQYKPDVLKKVVERMILQEKVDVLWGTNGTNLQKIVNQLADKYKVIAQNTIALSDEIQEGNDFSRYAFMTCPTTGQIGKGLAYYYGKVRKKEKKFYILGQDYSFGHALSDGFKEGLKEYFPEAQIVGEDYHKLFLTDYAPYISKIKNSGAEVVFTGDWPPDSTALLKQSRQLGLTLPFAHFFIDDPNLLAEVGYDGVIGNVQIGMYGVDGPIFKTDAQIAYYKAWNDLWKNKWKAPFNTILYKHPFGNFGAQIEQTYWMFSVMERAGSTNPDKIIEVFEGDKYQFMSGKYMEMRPCDHKTIQDLHVWEFVKPEEQKALFNIPPYYPFKDTAGAGLNFKIPREAIVPHMDKTLDRCK
ncbi:MAG: ABC transporter substrate-binding protein [bacterium]